MKSLSSKYSSTALAVAVIFSVPVAAFADNLQVSTVAPGYTVESIELGVPFGGSIAQHPGNPNVLYVSAGNYATHTILEVQLDKGTTRTVTPLVGNVGGLAVLNNGDLAITDNDDFSSDTILRARDLNLDGDFLDDGEITELISPILTSNFTGAQLAVAPSGNAAGIPTGSLLVQTADGGTASEVLVIENPESVPAYRPPGSAFFSGFNYNGGLAFTGDGHVLCGISEFPAGRVAALVNTNSDLDIDAGEYRDIVTTASLPNSIADLGASADGILVTTENSGTVRQFALPVNLLSGDTATASVLAETNGSYLSSARFNFPSRAFRPGSPGLRSTLYVGGYVTFPAATNLLAISPAGQAATGAGWELYQ